MKKTEGGIYVSDRAIPKTDNERPELYAPYSKKPLPIKEGVLDHEKLIQRNRAEVRRFLRVVRKLQKHKKSLIEISVTHKEDQSCCRTGPRWPELQQKLILEFYDKRKLKFKKIRS